MRWRIIFYLEDFPGIRTVGNMSKKKLTALIAVPALSFSLVACSDSGEDAAPEAITEEVAETPPRRLLLTTMARVNRMTTRTIN